ncbi:AAA family ATPase [Pseudomonas chlororaphis]|uniref:AAA family ATPase n=1 Tax=Pseudomonas chlororaphis TaxID=587753 RepID=UPI001CF4F709|nr:AAA family ATPase [Pseudomonas chlororaphis]UCR84297.1 AAA family ATPase [Pseudomonas chlororaphis]
MQCFDRSSVPPPSLLQSREASADRQVLVDYFLADKTKRAQSRVPESLVDLNEDSVRLGLSRLFHGKCAFCERAEVPTAIYRFRPRTQASPLQRTPDAHLYYVWLSSAWENLYAICKGCEPERVDYFPVRGSRSPLPSARQIEAYAQENMGLWRDYPLKEQQLLLDPCEQVDLARHLSVDLSGQLYGLSERGAKTIEHFKLNRLQVLKLRKIKLKEYFDELIDNWFFRSEGESPKFMLFDFATLDFGGCWYLLCRRLVLALAKSRVSPAALAPERIEETLRALSNSADVFDWFGDLESRLAESVVQRFAPASQRVKPLPREYPPLASIRFNNFKGIEQLELQMPAVQSTRISGTKPAQPALLILGENAAGKSSILEATALVLSGDKACSKLPIDISSLPLDPELLGVAQAPRCSSASVVATFQDGSQRDLTIEKDMFWHDGTHVVPPVFAYGAFRQYQRQVRRYSPSKSIINLFDSTALLSNPEKWLLGLKPDEFNTVVQALRGILSIEGAFDVMERDEQNQRCLIVTAAGDDQLLCRTPLSLASSGYRSVLAMACDIIQGLMDRRINPYFESLETAQAVVLIDEVEAHLHPRWKIQIMRALRQALPQVTFIASTHDPLCLRGMQDGEVIVMQRVPSEKRSDIQWPVMVEQLVRLPEVSQLTVEQLLTSDFFSLTSTDQPDTERELAHLADLLSARGRGELLAPPQQERLRSLERNISAALPVGSTEVQRLVQEAVVEYLDNRRRVSTHKLGQLRVEAKQRILGILEGL